MKWQTPKLICLSDRQAQGACTPGASYAGKCHVGPIAIGDKCQDGGLAGTQCQVGDSAGICKSGGAG